MLSLKRRFLISKNCKDKISIKNALFLLKKYSIFNFNESIDLSIHLSNDFKKKNKILRGVLNFPYNFLKFINVLILVDGFLEYLSRKNGYLNVGLFSLKSIFKKTNFKYFITTPKFYNYIYIFNDIILLENINLFVIDEKNLEDFLFNLDFFPYIFKSDKYGIINLSIGKLNYSFEFLEKNFFYFLSFLKNKKKELMIDKFILNKIFISTTMGLSYNISISNILF